MLRSIEKSITSALLPAILGDEPDAGGHRGRSASRARSGLPSTPHRAGVPAVDAEDRARHLAAAGADEARERDDLAAAHLERDVGEDALARQPLDLAARVSPGSAAPSGRARPCRARPSRG